MSRGSSVSTETKLRAGQQGFNSRQEQWWDFFLFANSSRPALGPTQPPNEWVPGALTPGVKRLEREGDHSPPSSAEIKNASIYSSIPQYVFTAWYLSKGKTFLHYMSKFSRLLPSTLQTPNEIKKTLVLTPLKPQNFTRIALHNPRNK
jgi:hypothetical protein